MISHNGKTIARTQGTDHDPDKGEHWQARAACRDYDPELWFPVGPHATDSPVWDKPRAVCATCPVRDACLDDAIEHDDTWGMRAGLTPQQLARLIQRPCRDCGGRAATGRQHCKSCADTRIRAGELACAGCGDIRHIRARGLCVRCWHEDMQAVRRAIVERAETVRGLMEQGLSTQAIAKRMGIRQRSVQRIIAREQVAS